jgi:hypothetical protein
MRAVGKREWRVRRVAFVVSEAFARGFEFEFEFEVEDEDGSEGSEGWAVEVARVVIREVSKARVDGIWSVVGSGIGNV